MPRELRFKSKITNWFEAEQEDGNKLRRFTMTAYTGAAMRLFGWRYPVVVDLQGIEASGESTPIYRDHDSGQIVGHTDEVNINANSLEVGGIISGVGPAAKEVVQSSLNGFPWQASIGAEAVTGQVEFISKSKKAEANGQVFEGPVYIVRKSILGEVSFVSRGADSKTRALIATESQRKLTKEKKEMDEFLIWAKEHDFDIEAFTDEQKKFLKEAYEVEIGKKKVNATDVQSMAELREELAIESERITAIRKICGSDHGEMEARAIREGWNEDKTKLEVMLAGRPQAPAIHASSDSLNTDVLEAACCLSVGLEEKNIVKDYGDKTLEAAYPMRYIGLRELVSECARLEGHVIPRVFGDGRETIRAAFSTLSLPGILENVMNKTLLSSYEAAEIVALRLCKVGSVSDFKEVGRYRLLGTGGFEPVAPDGELKHGKLGEQKFTNKADTYGQMIMLTRQDIINDDLGAFMDIPREMGRSGAQVIDDIFFQLLLSNPGNFFSVSNKNYVEGASSAFGPVSLGTAKTLFRKQKAGPGNKEKDKKPINIKPEMLVVPVEIETEAEQLMGSAQILLDGATSETRFPTDNPYRNKYQIVSPPHLSDSYYTGSSAKSWYLFANPNIIPAFEIVFLNGKRTPTIERIDAPVNMLGMGFRGYIDVGCKEQDPRGALKVKGEA